MKLEGERKEICINSLVNVDASFHSLPTSFKLKTRSETRQFKKIWLAFPTDYPYKLYHSKFHSSLSHPFFYMKFVHDLPFHSFPVPLVPTKHNIMLHLSGENGMEQNGKLWTKLEERTEMVGKNEKIFDYHNDICSNVENGVFLLDTSSLSSSSIS